tara:strand:- start:10193 stop:12937 length:2745 start_codon:yes stop_codon:yes gene_type:complete
MTETRPLDERKSRVLVISAHGLIALGLIVIAAGAVEPAWLALREPSVTLAFHSEGWFLLVGVALRALASGWRRTAVTLGIALAVLSLSVLPTPSVSSFCFFLTSAAIVILAGPVPFWGRVVAGQIIALAILAVALGTIANLLLADSTVQPWADWSQPSLSAALGFGVLAGGLLHYASPYSTPNKAPTPIAWPGVLFVAVFLIDLFTPEQVDSGILFLPLVFCCLWFERPHLAFLFAGFATALSLVGFALSPAQSIPDALSVTNRAFSIGGLWLVAIILFRYLKSIRRLRVNSEQLQLALEGSGIGLWDWHVQTGRVHYSPEWAQMLGYEVNELTPHLSTWERFLHPDDVEGVRAQIDRFLNGAAGHSPRFRMRHRNGHWRWVEARGRIIETDILGRPSRVAGSHLDITNDKEREDRLRLLQSAIDHSENVVLITTPDSADPRVVYASRSSVNVFGYTPAELMGKNPKFLQGANRDQEVLTRLRHSLETAATFDGELVNYRKDGSQYLIRLHIFPVRDVRGTLVNFASIGYDVTEERRVAEALRQEQDQFRSTLENSPIGIALVSPKGEWLHVNKALCNIVGYSTGELLQTDFQSITHPDDLDLDLKYVNEVLSGQRESYEMEKRYFHKSGHIVWILLTVSLVRNPDGTPRHFISQIQDISRRKQQENRINEYLRELERSNSELDDFCYIASHDLKEPLRGINNHSQSLIKHYSDRLDERGVHKLNRLVALTGRMERLINDLLYFSRLGRGNVQMETVDMGRLIQDQIDTLAPYLEEQNGLVEVAPEMPTLLCVPGRMAAVFRNLISNGLKYNESNERRVSITFFRHYKAATGTLNNVFRVEDNGIGIEPEFRGEIFRMFKRLHGEKAFGQGTGAGLSFVKKIVEQHGGDIWIESEPGQGSVFYFSIPGESDAQA